MLGQGSMEKSPHVSAVPCRRTGGRSGPREPASGGDLNLRVESPINSIHDASVSIDDIFVSLCQSN